MSVVSRQTDAELLDAARAGNVSAFGALYERHGGAARTLARQIVPDESVAEDIVAETFTKILDVIRWGGGPESAFRPYLLTAVRRTVHDRATTPPPQLTPEEIELRDPGATFVDPDLTGLECSAIARAFLSLPERWRMVLWHAEVENAKAADIAPLLGLSSGGVATLAYQAREGLREAYLQIHLGAEPGVDCRLVLLKMGAYARGGLSKADTRLVDAHVDDCPICRTIFLELIDITQGLRVIVGPLFAGPLLAAYLAGLGKAGVTEGAEGSGTGWFRRLSRSPLVVAAGTAAVVAAASLVVVSTDESATVPRRGAIPMPTPHTPTPRTPTARTPTALTPNVFTAMPPTAPSVKAPLVATPQFSPQSPSTRVSSTAGSIGDPSTAISSAPVSSATRATRAAPTRPRLPTSRLPRIEPPVSDPSRVRDAPPPISDPPRKPATLVATIDPLGTLVRARPGIVAVRLRNAGGRPSKELEAVVDLPQGVTQLDSESRQGLAVAAGPIDIVDGWRCRTDKQSVRCVRAALAPGRTASIFLRVNVAADAPEGAGLGVRVRAGGLRVNAKSGEGVRASGAAARFGADGRLVTQTIGNTLLSCPPISPGCASARNRVPGRRDNDVWSMTPVDRDADPATRSSSAARFDLPAGGRVLWAGLYWSATGPSDAPAGDIRVRAPRAKRYVTIRAAEVLHRTLPVGPGYLAFADVTRLARTAGHAKGRWWVADASMLAGVSRHAGWSLVVVAADPRQPSGRTAVLDTAVVIRGKSGPFEVPLFGLSSSAARARLDLVVWDGDADLRGDSVTLDDRRLRPRGGDRDVHDVFDGSVGDGRDTFGLDVDTFNPVLGRQSVLAISTTQDVLLFGVATVRVPTRP